ncbi:hypothetical protein [Thermococcus celer]|uniref:hypothetical protein n=1 Tax=Thermococcus celer TaxID=2264 RepID=UPI0019500C21|nr:hypothetical protein [Thermococcus celer]
MKRRTLYRALLAIVLLLTIVYTLGILGLVPFRWSYYITMFMIVLFLVLRMEKKRQ